MGFFDRVRSLRGVTQKTHGKWHMFLTGSLVLVLVLTGTIASATGAQNFIPVNLVFNGKPIGVEGDSYLVGDRTMAPLRLIAELLGATLKWDGSTRTVLISKEDSPSDQSRRIALLEEALRPENPKEVLDLWARGVKERNGALQFAMLSPNLKEAYLPQFESMGWVTGVSSPWVEQYKVTPVSQEDTLKAVFLVQFDEATSTGSAGSKYYRVTVERALGTQDTTQKSQPSLEKPEPGEWFIQDIDPAGPDGTPEVKDVLLEGYGISLELPSTWAVKPLGSDNLGGGSGEEHPSEPAARELAITNEKGQVVGGAVKLGGIFTPNHTSPVWKREVSTRIGQWTVYSLTRDEPAASGKKGQWKEVHAFFKLEDGNCLDFWLSTKEGIYEDIEALTLDAILDSSSQKPNEKTVTYKFLDGSEGWQGGFADLPTDYDPDIYELGFKWAPVPVEGRKDNGLMLKGHNRSDDLFMFVTKEVGKDADLKPNSVYKANLSFKLATNVAGGLFGIGGSPGGSVYVKAGFCPWQPEVIERDGYYDVNLSRGNQGSPGDNVAVLGNLEKAGSDDESYQYKSFQHSFDIATNEKGEAWVIIGTDSGFEGLTEIYLTNISLCFTEK